MTTPQDDALLKLLDCPFCGSDRVTVWGIRDGQQAVCKDCKSTGAPAFNGASGPEETWGRAVAAWNRRKDGLGTVSVKPLEWVFDHVRENVWYGNAAIPPHYRASGNVWWIVGDEGKKFVCDSLDEAKAAAQSDFETRVKSCLTVGSVKPLDPLMSAQELKLHMGEMTAQEMRTARAAIAWANSCLTSIGVEAGSARDVLAERQRQIEAEGWTPEHDDAHERGELARAAAAYAIHGTAEGYRVFFGDTLWPWAKEWWKPAAIKAGEVKAGRRRNLVKAGALILAEIERLDRAEASS